MGIGSISKSISCQARKEKRCAFASPRSLREIKLTHYQ
jgi:hypothetical protein